MLFRRSFAVRSVGGTFGGYHKGPSLVVMPSQAAISLSISSSNHQQSLAKSITTQANIKVCVIGAGAAGFYTAQHILKSPNTVVDIYESLPVPFGLVRYGVAPDHPEVKNCINTFTQVAKNPRCNYFGNVKLGADVGLREFREAYHAVVLTYGADNERQLNVPGEKLKNVISARQLVNWYNGHPSRITSTDISLETEHCVVIGHGNVALDIARILLSPLDKIKATDITEEALEALSHSRVKRVTLIGRRGPMQVAFTIKEFRELIKLPQTLPYLHREDFKGIDTSKLERPRKRLTELMLKTLNEQRTSSLDGCPKTKVCELKFFRSPLEFIEDLRAEGCVGSILLSINKLEDGGRIAVPTGMEEILPTGLVLKSVGYSSSCPDDAIPFDGRKGIIANEAGRVTGLPGVYCSGWVKTGPIGVIVSTMNSSFETGSNLLSDINKGAIDGTVSKPGRNFIVNDILKKKGVRHVTFDQWERIAAYEAEMGAKKNKLADKVLSVQKMLEIAWS
ncbi:NADPH:adrenodoxin oxidoreductase, mitochondrial-like [Varroa jacobsoni]|uniref:NADPH:adrenodoxin oxidoreductase, mitochondrial-like n=1 Tax=Varroa jacobsoni TaxID=62625 RepID=UPI000BF38941|nr:NADPH:adrenodoxin oxidoreductase, mitochondrial-like [Varroa jacobsoni]XP_022695840.1 NADPH:adrenodoxin oxidoreductase, mitochondrial-like [Varroa jacobsoni]